MRARWFSATASGAFLLASTACGITHITERVSPYHVSQDQALKHLTTTRFFTDTAAPIILTLIPWDSGGARPAVAPSVDTVALSMFARAQGLFVPPATPGRAVAIDSSAIDLDIGYGILLQFAVPDGAGKYQYRSYVLERINGVAYRVGASVVVRGKRYRVEVVRENRLFYRHKRRFCCD